MTIANQKEAIEQIAIIMKNIEIQLDTCRDISDKWDVPFNYVVAEGEDDWESSDEEEWESSSC